MLLSRAAFSSLAVSLVLVSLGCGSGTPDVYPTSGTVTYKGTPVEGAQVSFIDTEATRAAMGTTDAEGRFQLSTYGDKDGAPPGNHTVTIVKVPTSVSAGEMSAEDGGDAYAQAMMQASSGEIQSEIPAKYGDPTQSGLTAKVTSDGENDFAFALE